MATESGHHPSTVYQNQGGATVNYPSGTSLEFFSGATCTFDSGATESHANNPTFSGTPVFSGNPSFTGIPAITGDLKVGLGTTDVPVAATSGGILYIPTTTGTPTGSIAVSGIGMVPLVYDRINKLLYIQPASGTWVKYATA